MKKLQFNSFSFKSEIFATAGDIARVREVCLAFILYYWVRVFTWVIHESPLVQMHVCVCVCACVRACVCVYPLSSHEHIELLSVNNELLFFRQRGGHFCPTLRLLHKCKETVDCSHACCAYVQCAAQ